MTGFFLTRQVFYEGFFWGSSLGATEVEKYSSYGIFDVENLNFIEARRLVTVGGGERKVLAGSVGMRMGEGRTMSDWVLSGGGGIWNQLEGGNEHQPNQSQGTRSPGFPFAGQIIVKKTSDGNFIEAPLRSLDNLALPVINYFLRVF